VLNNEIDWRIKLKIIESLQKKQGKNQAKKKELGPNLKILKNENSRLKDAIRKKKLKKWPRIKIDKSKEWGPICKYTQPRGLAWNFKC